MIYLLLKAKNKIASDAIDFCIDNIVIEFLRLLDYN